MIKYEIYCTSNRQLDARLPSNDPRVQLINFLALFKVTERSIERKGYDRVQESFLLSRTTSGKRQ